MIKFSILNPLILFFIGFVLVTLTFISQSIIFASFCIMTFSILFLSISRPKIKRILNIMEISTYLFILGFSVRPLVLLGNGNFYRTDWNLVDQFYILTLNAQLVGFTLMIIMVFGYQSFKLTRVEFQVTEVSVKRVLFMMLISIFSLSIYISNSGFRGTQFFLNVYHVEKSGNYVFFFLCWIVTPLFFIPYKSEKTFPKISKGLKYCIFLLGIFIALAFSSRKWIILMFLTPLAQLSYRRDGITVFKLGFSAIALVMLLIILLLYRRFMGNGEFDDISLLNEIAYNHLVMGGVLSYFDYFARYLASYNYGYRIVYPFDFLATQLLPGSVSELVGIQKELPYNKLIAEMWPASTTAVAPAVSVFGEILYTGGLPFALIVGYLYGVIFKLLDFLLVQRASHYRVALSVFIFHAMFIILRTGLLSSIVNLIFCFSFYLILNKFYDLMFLRNHISQRKG